MNLRTLLAACAATLLASNAQAVAFPPVPLESGAQYPPPNVRFILDDSTSMSSIGMPATLRDPAHTADNGPPLDPTRIAHASYTRNSLYYDPQVTYRPWMTGDAVTRLPDASYERASRGTTLLDDWVDLRDSAQTFYVPKRADVRSVAEVDYYRWQIVPDSSANVAARGRIVRSEWLPPGPTSSRPLPGSPFTGLTDASDIASITNVRTFVVPAGMARLVVELAGGSHGTNAPNYNNHHGAGADLALSNGADLTHPVCFSNGPDNLETCVVDNPLPGTWYAGIHRDSRYEDVTMTASVVSADPRSGEPDTGCSLAGIGNAWRNCTFMLPSSRSEAVEKLNYANWYTYHRSRMKVAKAGASEAFSRIGENLRIGFDSINRSVPGIPLDIPVLHDDGLFRGANRTAWYGILHATKVRGSTPLHRGLQRAGQYFSDTTAANNPWKTSSSSTLISCRQNFAILTTDGYWNSYDGYAGLGDADGTAGPAIAGAKGETYAYAVAPPFQDDMAPPASHRTDTLADVAMHYWKNDLAPLPNNVPTATDDPAFWQHMVTFGVSIGLNGTLDPNVDLPALKLGSKHWPDVRADDPNLGLAERIDDLWHASVNGHGDFTVANNTEEFARGLTDAFTLVAARQGSASNVSANSASFVTDTRVFQASYTSGRWNGDVLAFAATPAGVSAVPLWRASEGLSGARKFFTWDGGAGAGALFPTAAQRTALDASSRSQGPATAAENVAYLEGARALERQNGGGLRDRTSVLGDIVNSSPFFVKDTNTVYVGANDGMLHAIDAATGIELFAYVPHGINLADLGSLSSPGYVHKYFVDGPLVVTTRDQTPGLNYLVGTLGRGGKGVFGLDVSDPAGFAADDVLWETTHADLGNVLGEPLIASTNGGEKVAIVGNGPNSTGGRAVLFVLDVATGAILHRLDTGIGGDNGLFAPRGWDDDGNGTVDYVYAGDRRGNVWKFDFTGATPAVALGGAPLFVTAPGQPITTGVALAKDPATGKRWVFVGTGSYMTAGDPADATVQSIYGLIDEDAPLLRSDLQDRDILITTTLGGRRVRGFEPNASLPGAKKGWFVDLDDPAPGERIVTRPQVRGSVLLFSSRTPPTDNTCDAGGAGFLNAIDAFTGSSTTQPYFDANGDGIVDGSDSVTDGADTVPAGSIDLGIGMPTSPIVIDRLIVVGGSTGTLGSIDILPLGGVPRRISWREIEPR